VLEVTKLLRAALPASIEIQTILPPGLPNVLADGGQIHQVLMNLGTNAAYAMRKEGGVLEIAISRVVVNEAAAQTAAGLNAGNYLRLILRDTGEGMPPQVLARIFEPFFTTKPEGQGTGLGLSVVHGIIKAHDGAISVRSEVGRGTRIEVFLPAIEDRVSSANGAAAEIPRGDGESILYVDDESALCRLVELSLMQCGYHGVAKSDPVEALRLFVESPGRFKVVITDFTMANMSGMDLVSRIREMSPSTPVVLTTGYTGNLDVPALNAAGVTEVLAKPFNRQTLAQCLHRVIAGR
jgi:CheY-like chemotaxis protein